MNCRPEELTAHVARHLENLYTKHLKPFQQLLLLDPSENEAALRGHIKQSKSNTEQ